MKNTINLFLILIIFSCSDSKIKEPKQTENRYLRIFDFRTLVYSADYELTIRERDSVVIYDYTNKTDSTKNRSFRYLKHSDHLMAGPLEFEKIESDRYPKTIDFDIYNSDPGIMDGMGPVIFNKNYGVLGFDNGMGTQYYFTNDSTKYIELPILYKAENAKSNLEGTWVMDNPNFYSEIHFYENNIWKRTFKNYKNDTIIEKGKFTIAKDSAIFFRYFGSQHWINKDTINDYKTSMGSFVLFLNSKNELIDNQEDYEQTYKKIK